MSKHDLYHDEVKAALIKDGWTITHDPLTIPGIGLSSFHIDLGAERLIGAEKQGEKIAVEIKSFLSLSFASEFHTALGQYLDYLIELEKEEPNRVLFLAVPNTTFELYFYIEHIRKVIERFNLRVMVFDFRNKIIIKWIK